MADRLSAAKPSRMGLYLPVAAFVALCTLWTGLWFFSANRAEAIAEAFIAREAERGRDWLCPKRSIAGFPFSITLTCAEPRLVVMDPQGLRREGRLGALALHARISSPGRFIAVLGGPFVARDPQGGQIEMNWQDARINLVAGAESISEASVWLNAPTLAAGFGGEPDLRALAKGVELHLRRSAGDKPGTDLVAQIADLTFTPLDHLTGSKDPIRMEMQVSAPALVPDPRQRFQDALEQWRQGGNRARVVVFKTTKGNAVVDLSGELGLDDLHRPEGNLQGRARGLDALLGALTRRGGIDMGGLLGRMSGGQGMPIALSLERGRMRMGPFTLMELAPLY